jgi:cell division protein FtsB
VSRAALLVVALVMVYLYAGPARSYWSAMQEAESRRNDVMRLKRENADLRARRETLRSEGALEREARKLGMVRPGERPYVVEGLPR